MLRIPVVLLVGLCLGLTACDEKLTERPLDTGGPCSASYESVFGAQGQPDLSGWEKWPKPDWRQDHVKGELLVFSSAASASISSQGWASTQALLTALSPQPLGGGLQLLQVPAGRTEQELAAQLMAAGFYVQPNYIYKLLTMPNDPGYMGNAGIMVAERAQHQDYLQRINVTAAWQEIAEKKLSHQGVLTAVLDSGVNVSHEDLKGRLRDGCTFDFTGKGQIGAEEDAQSNIRGHGTANAGIISANTNNNVGLAGMTWGSQNILPIRVFQYDKDGSFTADTVTLRMGILTAIKQNAKVINMSLGAVNFGNAALDQTLIAASRYAVLVAAAGNTSEDGIYSPARHTQVIAVGALAKDDKLACYSARPNKSQIRQLDLVAPGGNAGTSDTVLRTIHSGCLRASPDDILTLNTSDQGSGYALRAGTSVAAPMVSGVASLILGAVPRLPPAEVKDLLMRTAKRLPQNDGTQLRLLDAHAALKEALRLYGQ